MRWKYVYCFLIVTFLVVIFVSLISISVSMYLKERRERNKTVAIYPVEPATNRPTSDTEDNYNCSTSVSDQSIDNVTNKPVGDGLGDDNKIILTAGIHSAYSASTLINKQKTDRIDNLIPSGTSQSTNKIHKGVVTDRKNIFDQNKKDLTGQSTSTPDESIQWLDIDNPDWILPIFYRNESEIPSIWKYGCMGMLVHPKAVLAVHFAVNKSREVTQAVGVFDRTKGRNKIYVDYDHLYNPLKVTDVSSYKLLEFSYILNNGTRSGTKFEPGLLLMIMKEAINSIKPVDIVLTSLMPLPDIFNEKIVKECIHVTFVKNSNTQYFEEIKISESLMNRSAMVESYTTTYRQKCSESCELKSINYIEEFNVFGTVDSLKFDDPSQKFNLLGSPLACRIVSNGPNHYSLAGILINSFYTGMYEYANVYNELEGIQQDLYKL